MLRYILRLFDYILIWREEVNFSDIVALWRKMTEVTWAKDNTVSKFLEGRNTFGMKELQELVIIQKELNSISTIKYKEEKDLYIFFLEKYIEICIENIYKNNLQKNIKQI